MPLPDTGNLYLEDEIKKTEIECEYQKAIISKDMAKLKDQYDVTKRAITMMEQDVSECMLLAESEKDLAYVVKISTKKEV